jgi:hypothetical protein
MVRRSVGVGLLSIGCFMLFSSVMYVIGGGEAWFSRLSLGVVTLGLWYVGTSPANSGVITPRR